MIRFFLLFLTDKIEEMNDMECFKSFQVLKNDTSFGFNFQVKKSGKNMVVNNDSVF